MLETRNNVKKAVVLCLMSGTTAEIIGTTGCGKSAMAEEIAAEYGKKLVTINAALQSVEDLIGIPYREGDQMYWSRPAWFPTEPNTLLFVDEINRTDKSVINALMPMLLNGILHEHKLPKDCWCMTASNPDTSDYDLVSSYEDMAVSSRMCKLQLGTDLNAWKDWLKSTNRVVPHLLNSMEEELVKTNKQLEFPQPACARSFTKMIDMIITAKEYNKTHKDYFDKDVVLLACGGIIGKEYVGKHTDEIIVSFQSDEGISNLIDLFKQDMDISNVLKRKADILNAMSNTESLTDEELDSMFEWVGNYMNIFPEHTKEIISRVKIDNNDSSFYKYIDKLNEIRKVYKRNHKERAAAAEAAMNASNDEEEDN